MIDPDEYMLFSFSFTAPLDLHPDDFEHRLVIEQNLVSSHRSYDRLLNNLRILN